jgi:translation initiation factor 2B subunit (eIF-2B alpha/beta/delta family)
VTWQAFVKRIRADNTSGAAELAREAALAVLRWVDHTLSMAFPEWRAELSALAMALYMALPAHVGIPCYVVSDRHKWFPAAPPPIDLTQLKPDLEVWRDPPAGVSIRNAYFECTPMQLFSGIIGEEGLQGPEDLLQQLIDMPVAQALRGSI